MLDTLQGLEIREYIGLVYGVNQDVTGGIREMGGKLMLKEDL